LPKTATIFEIEQSWGPPIDFRRRSERWPLSATVEFVTLQPTPAAREILGDTYWSRKIERGLADSAADRARSFDEYLGARP
jgi:hypothetical protein